jgi:transposase
MPRGRHTSLTIHLTADDRQTLTAWQRSTTIPAGRARRGQIMLVLADGMPVVQIADTVGVTHRVVYKWAQRFLQDGIAGLADKPGRGRRPVLTTPVKGGQASRRKRARTRTRRSSHHLASRSAMARGRKTALMIRLTADDRQTLTRWQRSPTIRAGYANRGRMLLLLADGLPVVQVATMVGITRRFVYKWARRFVQYGLEGLTDKPGRGRRPVPR